MRTAWSDPRRRARARPFGLSLALRDRPFGIERLWTALFGPPDLGSGRFHAAGRRATPNDALACPAGPVRRRQGRHRDAVYDLPHHVLAARLRCAGRVRAGGDAGCRCGRRPRRPLRGPHAPDALPRYGRRAGPARRRAGDLRWPSIRAARSAVPTSAPTSPASGAGSTIRRLKACGTSATGYAGSTSPTKIRPSTATAPSRARTTTISPSRGTTPVSAVMLT